MDASILRARSDLSWISGADSYTDSYYNDVRAVLFFELFPAVMALISAIVGVMLFVVSRNAD